MRNLTKVQAVQEFKELHGELIKNKSDKPAIRTAWNDFVDSLEKEGRISERQAYNWEQPAFCK